MPYPSQVNPDSIVSAACEIIQREGVDALSLGRLAARLGVKAPSLYRYFKNKAALLKAVNQSTLVELFAAFDHVLSDDCLTPDAPQDQLVAIAHTVRQFAHQHPRRYVLAMTAQVSVTRPNEDRLVQMVLPIQAIMAKLTGEQASLTALRGFLALIHGFVMLEVHEQLQRGGDLDAAFDDSLHAYLAGWQQEQDQSLQ
jgi:AcrR family transcriptional regulator